MTRNVTYLLLLGMIKDKELKTLVREVSNSNLRTTVEFNEFLQLMSRKLKNDGCEEELIEAFRYNI